MRRIDELTAERDSLMQLLGAVRVALHTPDDVDIVQHAQVVAAKAAKWDAVPWDAVGGVIVGWELGSDIDDDIADLQQWMIASKGVQRS